MDGEEERVCSGCNEKETRVIPAIIHGDKNSETEKAASVKTGDDTHMSLWLLLLIVSGASIVMVLPFPKKKRRIG